MALIRPNNSAIAGKIRLLWPLLCLLLVLPTSVLAVCGTAPTVSFDSAGKYAASGESVDYLVTITNNDAGSCNLDLSLVSVDAAGFNSSLPNGTPLTVAGLATDSTTILRVAVAGGTADWLINTTTLSVDAVNTVATTTVFDNDPLLHNSINMGSTKHGGNWGTTKAGSKYGSFSCQTCHVQGTNNIKRIRTSITAPDGTNSLPGDGALGGTVSFLSTVDGSADMGDDTGGHPTSNRICETCHTYDALGTNGVKYHAYTMPSDPGHYNRRDCIGCHKHKSGFKASCSSCHGGGTIGTTSANFWPDGNSTIGRHLTHMNDLSQHYYGLSATALLSVPNSSDKQIDLCGYCHPTPGADADHASATPAETAFRPFWDKTGAVSGSYTRADGNCTNICHNNKPTGVDDEPGGAATWGWNDTGTSACLMCHNDITDTAVGTTGATHDRHLNLATDFGPTLVCGDCHDFTNFLPTHINGTLNIVGTKVAADEYTGTSIPGANFGSCSGGAALNTCHNDGSMLAAPARAYVWGSELPNDCASCHASLPTTNAHAVHVQTADAAYGSGTAWPAGNNSTAGAYDFSCVNCHGTTKSNHLNGVISVPVGGYSGAPNGTCASAACHTDGTSPTAYKTTPAWNANFTVGACNGCHGNFPTTAAHPQHSLEVGFHYNAIYSGLTEFLPVTDADAASVDQNLDDIAGPGDSTPGVVSAAGSGYDQLRGHGGNLTPGGTATSTVVSCNVCHFETVTVNVNDLGSYTDADPNTKACSECHNGTVTAMLGVAAIADKSSHVNGAVKVLYFNEKVRSKAQLRDENVYTVTASPETAWTDTLELTNNWQRVNGYKAVDGSSYDEQPGTLHDMAVTYGGASYYSSAAKTCMVSCHLWEAGRVDKVPVHWVDNASGGSAPLMCIDCHTRLPK